MIRKRSSCVKGAVSLLLLALVLINLSKDSSKGLLSGVPSAENAGNRFGRAPKVENSSATYRSVTRTRDKEGEEQMDQEGIKQRAEQEAGLTKEREKQEAGLKKEMEDQLAGLKKEDEEPGERKPVESLAGEREHRVPNITAPREEEGKGGQAEEVEDILYNIREANKQQMVWNEDLYGPLNDSSIVIAIQVHDRIKYLRELILSLSSAQGIQNCLLVFSHDVWDEDINQLVRSIDFAMVVQVFYPFSLQTHPTSFPGQSANDCPRDLKPAQVSELQCLNKEWPDLYGHYREAKFTQTKHHWWWKANQIFQNLNITKTFNGLVLFLEEDHYVAEDFLHVLHVMQDTNAKLTYPANILCLGTYLKKFNYKEIAKQVEVTQWISSKHNMGMAFTRQLWNKFLQCSSHFCQYDDYNWDWSLLHVSLNCLREKLLVMMVKGPRVFHIGECGVHHKKSNCGASLVMDKVKNIINTAREFFFPDSLAVTVTAPRKKIKLKKGNGGWGDKRDHALCLNMTLGL